MVVAVVFAVCLLGFAGIGMASSRQALDSPDDYLVARRSISPWLIGLSSVATNCSGYMFIGQMGLTYRIGVSSVWLAVGWILGDALVWWRFYPGIREASEAGGARTFAQLVAKPTDRVFVSVIALLVLLFLGSYAAAQLEAGDKALRAVLGVPRGLGAAVGAVVVLLYSMSGGIRASIWTDAAQALVMMASMASLLVYSLADIGGLSALFTRLEEIDPRLVDPFAGGGALGFPAWALGWIGAGIGVLGQPTLVVRAMAIRSSAELPRAARTYFGWFVPFYAATIVLGLCSRVLLPHIVDAEMALPSLASSLFPEALVGLMLAGVFAATMSTADSQILSCSAAIVEDLAPRLARVRGAHKAATAAVCLFSLCVAYFSGAGVFALVLHAWAALGVTLGPLAALRATRRPVPGAVGVAMCVAGLVTMFAWRAAGLADATYEIVPGVIASLLVYFVGTWRNPSALPAR